MNPAPGNLLSTYHPAGVRDAAMIAVLYWGGLRRAEIAALQVAQHDAAAGALKVHGKGDKQRLVYITVGAAQALQDWLAWRGDEAAATSGTPALFCPILKNGSLQAAPLPSKLFIRCLYLKSRSRFYNEFRFVAPPGAS